MPINKPFKRGHLSAMSAAVLVAACGGGGDDSSVTAASSADRGPLSAPVRYCPDTANPRCEKHPPANACSFDTSVPLAYEERRLETPLPFAGINVIGTDQTPLAVRIVRDTGFDTFAPDFAKALCDNGRTNIASLPRATRVVKDQGHALWRAAVDRAQGRRASPAGSILPNSDDRMLYWARVQMTKVLRQWKPGFALTAEEAAELQWQFERASRGQYDIDFEAGRTRKGKPYRRMIISGFDTFTLGIPGTPNTGLRNGNPSGATALALDGQDITLADGSVMRIEAYILPVSYDPFNKGMQEDTLGPFFERGPRRVDASITISQGSPNVFNLEQWNGRFHGPSPGNDGILYCPSGATRIPSYVLPLGTVTGLNTDPISLPGSGCNIYPPERWLGYDALTTWMKDFSPQFSAASLPIEAMVTGHTQVGIVRPPGARSLGTEGFNVTWHTNYSYFPDCSSPQIVSVPSNNVFNAMPDPATIIPPSPDVCAAAGGGGTYLSNESAYRNTVLRDTYGLDIPAGHIHTPVMTNFYNGSAAAGGFPRDDNAMTDARFEAYRTAIVGQTRALLVVIGNSLGPDVRESGRDGRRPPSQSLSQSVAFKEQP